MSTAKEELTRLSASQPADSTHEEIVRELAFHVMVSRGLADSDSKQVVSNDEMATRIRTWQKSRGLLKLSAGSKTSTSSFHAE